LISFFLSLPPTLPRFVLFFKHFFESPCDLQPGQTAIRRCAWITSFFLSLERIRRSFCLEPLRRDLFLSCSSFLFCLLPGPGSPRDEMMLALPLRKNQRTIGTGFLLFLYFVLLSFPCGFRVMARVWTHVRKSTFLSPSSRVYSRTFLFTKVNFFQFSGDLITQSVLSKLYLGCAWAQDVFFLQNR